MKRLKKILVYLMIILTVEIYTFPIGMLNIGCFVSVAEAIEKEPGFIVSEELDYPAGGLGETDKRSWLSRNKWWVALSIVIAAGAAALASSGGGGGGSGDGNSGQYVVTW